MKTYQQYKEQLSAQLKGHHLRLFAILLVSSLLISLCKDSLIYIMDAKSLMYSILSFLLSLFFSLINYVILFLFIQRVRNESFGVKDVQYGASRFIYLILAGLNSFLCGKNTNIMDSNPESGCDFDNVDSCSSVSDEMRSNYTVYGDKLYYVVEAFNKKDQLTETIIRSNFDGTEEEHPHHHHFL